MGRKRVGLGLVLVLAGQVAVLSHSAAQTAPTASPGIVAAKIATTLEVAAQNTDRGHKVALSALLISALGQGMGGQPVTFRVREPSGKLVASCSSTTDSKGRATCYYQVPSLHYAFSYDVNALYVGNAQFARAEDTSKLLVGPPAHTGSLKLANGAQVSVGHTEGMLGRYVKLRAHVEANGAPVTSGRVRFWANGKHLAAANVDGTGLARVLVSPTASQLSTFLHIASVKHRVGGLQAWYEPPAGAKLLPGMGIGDMYVADASTSCQHIGLTSHARCSVATASPSHFQQTRLGVFTVYKNSYGSAQVTTQPQIKIAFAVPPKPAPNADCNATLISVGSSFCDRSCERLEYYAFDAMGNLQFLKGNPSAKGAQACTWELATDLSITTQAYQLAHDECAAVALKQGHSNWSHTANMKVPHWLAAGFKFRDPHVVPIGTPSMLDIAMQNADWKATLGWETLIRETTAQINVSVNCR